MSWWNALISPITNLVSKPLEQWGDRKKIKLESKMKVVQFQAEAQVKRAEGQLELIKQGKETESDWDKRAQEQMKFSWKDEVLMCIIFFPVVLLFLTPFCKTPEFQKKVIMSVNALNQFPLWYVVLLCGIVAAIFGLRWLIAPLITKMATKKKE